MANYLDSLADLLRKGSDTLVNLPIEAQRFITNPQAFTEVVTGKNPLPKETGFVAGATGLPPKNPVQGGALNPAAAPYQEGYEQGEPVAIASMAVPAYAGALRAGAPKAYNALENYMVKSGGMIPLEAYHGTPHKILGKFDISKVGTGEGAQAYGHGMYFAENPAVAGEYKRKLSGGLGSPSNELMLNGQPLTDLTESQRRAYEIVARDGRKNALGTAKDLEAQGFDASHIRDALKTTKGQEISLTKNEGNLYKVDIPDEHIPNMLDWDKPVPEDIRKNISKAALEQFGSGATGTSGEKLYKEVVFEMRAKGSKNPEADASKWLSKQGITGIRYLDQGSRTPGFSSLTPTQLESRIASLQADIKSGGGNTQKMKDQLKGLQNELDSYKNMTSNFVVFDPSTVKILEENAKPVSRKELIEKQVKSLKE